MRRESAASRALKAKDAEITDLRAKIADAESAAACALAALEKVRAERDEAQGTLAGLEFIADELTETLREHWKALEVDALRLYCISLISGFAAAWKENPPENGFVTSAEFPGCGRLEIDIRKAGAKSAAEAIGELRAERDRLLAAWRVGLTLDERPPDMTVGAKFIVRRYGGLYAGAGETLADALVDTEKRGYIHV